MRLIKLKAETGCFNLIKASCGDRGKLKDGNRSRAYQYRLMKRCSVSIGNRRINLKAAANSERRSIVTYLVLMWSHEDEYNSDQSLGRE